MSTHTDELAALRAEVAELRARLDQPRRPHRRLPRIALLVLAAALTLPAGAVLASHRFGDVPTDYQFHNSISAIADAGITTGCGGGNYCPDGLVTRGQMAAFLNRLGALEPGSPPKVNADKVDGYHGSELLLGTGTIPSGTTITGVETWRQPTGDDGANFGFSVQLPARAPQPLTETDVNFAPDTFATDGDPACSGSTATPTAPPGKVCIYLYGSGLVSGLHGGGIAPSHMRDRAFTVLGTGSGSPGNTLQVIVIWAYTAP